jgi:hypothetical protein
MPSVSRIEAKQVQSELAVCDDIRRKSESLSERLSFLTKKEAEVNALFQREKVDKVELLTQILRMRPEVERCYEIAIEITGNLSAVKKVSEEVRLSRNKRGQLLSAPHRLLNKKITSLIKTQISLDNSIRSIANRSKEMDTKFAQIRANELHNQEQVEQQVPSQSEQPKEEGLNFEPVAPTPSPEIPDEQLSVVHACAPEAPQQQNLLPEVAAQEIGFSSIITHLLSKQKPSDIGVQRVEQQGRLAEKIKELSQFLIKRNVRSWCYTAGRSLAIVGSIAAVVTGIILRNKFGRSVTL